MNNLFGVLAIIGGIAVIIIAIAIIALAVDFYNQLKNK